MKHFEKIRLPFFFSFYFIFFFNSAENFKVEIPVKDLLQLGKTIFLYGRKGFKYLDLWQDIFLFHIQMLLTHHFSL